MGKFQKGQSGNPKGRPKKGTSLTDILQELGLQKDVKIGAEMLERRRGLADKVWRLALGGDVAAMRMIYDRIDGKPVETHDLRGADGKDLSIRFEKDFEGL